MNTERQREAFREYVEEVLGYPACWRRFGQPYADPSGQVQVIMNITSRVAEGDDDERPVSMDHAIVTTVVGFRKAVVTCRIDCYDTDMYAADVAEKFRVRKHLRPDLLETLSKYYGLVLLRVANIQDLTDDSLEAVFSVATFECEIGYVVCEDDRGLTDADGLPVGNWIESVELVDNTSH